MKVVAVLLFALILASFLDSATSEECIMTKVCGTIGQTEDDMMKNGKFQVSKLLLIFV